MKNIITPGHQCCHHTRTGVAQESGPGETLEASAHLGNMLLHSSSWQATVTSSDLVQHGALETRDNACNRSDHSHSQAGACQLSNRAAPTCSGSQPPRLPVSPSPHLSISPSPRLPVSPSPCLPISPSLQLPISPSPHLSISLSHTLTHSSSAVTCPASHSPWLRSAVLKDSRTNMLRSVRNSLVVQALPANVPAWEATRGASLERLNVPESLRKVSPHLS